MAENITQGIKAMSTSPNSRPESAGQHALFMVVMIGSFIVMIQFILCLMFAYKFCKAKFRPSPPPYCPPVYNDSEYDHPPPYAAIENEITSTNGNISGQLTNTTSGNNPGQQSNINSENNPGQQSNINSENNPGQQSNIISENNPGQQSQISSENNPVQQSHITSENNLEQRSHIASDGSAQLQETRNSDATLQDHNNLILDETHQHQHPYMMIQL